MAQDPGGAIATACVWSADPLCTDTRYVFIMQVAIGKQAALAKMDFPIRISQYKFPDPCHGRYCQIYPSATVRLKIL
jgi:hypothetical protein